MLTFPGRFLLVSPSSPTLEIILLHSETTENGSCAGRIWFPLLA